MTHHFVRLMRNEDGATAIEYVLIASLVSVVIVAALTSIGASLSTRLIAVANAL